MLSLMWRAAMKPPWLGEIKEGIIVFSLRDRTLENILYDALQKEIGLKGFIVVGLGSLGIKARKVELVAPPILPLDIHEMRRIKSFLMKFQHNL